MRAAVLLVIPLLLLGLGEGTASGFDATVVEYTSPVGGSDSFCRSQDSFYGAAAGFVRGTLDAVGQDAPDLLLHCGEVPPGATSVHVSIADDQTGSVLATFSQFDEDGTGFHQHVCNAATVPLNHTSGGWTVHLLPYGQTTQACPDAGPPTHGFVTLAWS